MLSFVPVAGEIYDASSLYLQKDPFTGEPLSRIGSVFTVIGLASGVGSGKIAREGGEKVIREIVEQNGYEYDLVQEAADTVAKQIDFGALLKKGTGAYTEVKERIVKEAEVLRLAKLSAIATKIANGHAFQEHIHEFAHLNIKTIEQFTTHVNTVIKTPTESFIRKNGKEYFWHEPTKTFAIIDKNNPDMGTIFIPTRGKDYYLDQIVK